MAYQTGIVIAGGILEPHQEVNDLIHQEVVHQVGEYEVGWVAQEMYKRYIPYSRCWEGIVYINQKHSASVEHCSKDHKYYEEEYGD